MRKLLRIYICAFAFLLPFLFGSYASGTESPNFPVNLFEWLVSGLTPSWPAWLAPIFAGVALLAAAIIHRPPAKSRLLLLCFLWGLPLIGGLIGLCVTTEYDYACNWLLHFTGALAFAVAVKWTSDSDDKLLPALFSSVVVASLLLCLCGWYQHFIGLDSMLQMFRENAAKTGIPLDGQLEQKLLQKRIYAFFIDPNLLAAHLILVAPLAVVALSRWSRHFQPVNVSRIVFIIGGIFLYVITIFWTGSRGGAIGLCVGIAVFIWCQPFIQKLRWRWLLPIAAAVAVVAVVFVATRSKERDGAKSASARMNYYKVCVQMFKERPLTGLGLGEFFPNYMRLKPVPAEETRDPHNFLLGMAGQCGVIGGLAALIALLFPFVLALKGKLSDGMSPSADLPPAVLAGLAAWSVHALFEFNELIPGTFFIVGWFICLALPAAAEDAKRLPAWTRVPAIVLACIALIPLLRIPAEYEFQLVERGEAGGNPFGILKELDEKLPRSIGPVDLRFKPCLNALLPRPDTLQIKQTMPKDYAAENAWQAANILVKRTPHRPSHWYKYALTAAAIGKWDEATHAIFKARGWYPTNGDYCLLDAVIQSRRAEWLPFIRIADVKMHEQPDGSVLALYDIPETFVPQFKEITELANSINIHLQDGRPVRFDFTPIPTPQTAP